MTRMGSLALSVVIGHDGRVAGATHPNGNLVTLWSVSDGELLGATRIEKPEGIVALADGELLVTALGGRLTRLKQRPLATSGLDVAPALNWKHALAWTAPRPTG
jgi:hypothetical protein